MNQCWNFRAKSAKKKKKQSGKAKPEFIAPWRKERLEEQQKESEAGKGVVTNAE